MEQNTADTDLRDRIAAELRASGGILLPVGYEWHLADVVLAVVQPELDRRDADARRKSEIGLKALTAKSKLANEVSQLRAENEQLRQVIRREADHLVAGIGAAVGRVTAVRLAEVRVIPEPDACRWCDIPQRGHFRQWHPEQQWHTWQAPIQRQRLERMLARREARTEVPERGDGDQ